MKSDSDHFPYTNATFPAASETIPWQKPQGSSLEGRLGAVFLIACGFDGVGLIMGTWLAPQVVGRLVWKEQRGGGASATQPRLSLGMPVGQIYIPLEHMLLTIQVDLTRKASNRGHSHIPYLPFTRISPSGKELPAFSFLERKERNPGHKRLHRPFMAWHGI